MAQKLLLVDTPNQIFRAYYGIMSDMRSPDGFPTRALFGFTRIMKQLVRELKPDYLACVFDHGADARLALWPEYKGTRPDMPDDLRQQWPEFEPLCAAFGFKVLGLQGVGADDIIGTLARRFGSPELEVQIVSSDKDFGQLVNEHVHVLDLGKNQVVDRAGVIERWGVPPEKIVDLLALMGDTSDNVPGVPGVGPKKAAQFIEKYGDVEGVLANWDKIGGKTGEAVRDAAAAARLARKLVEIDTDVPVSVSLEELRPAEPDAAELQRRLLRYNFKTLWNELGLGDRAAAARVGAAIDGAAGAAGAPKLEDVWGRGPVSRLCAALRAAGRFALALEGPADGPPVRLGFAWAAGWVWTPGDSLAHPELRALLADAAVKKTGFELKAAVHRLRAAGVELRGVGGDVVLGDYLLIPEVKRSLDHLSRRWLEEPAAVGAGAEAQQVWRLDRIVQEKLGADRVYRDIELPLVEVLARMEAAGIRCDVAHLAAISEGLGARVEAAQAEVHALAGEPFNVNSPLQLAVILYDKMQLGPARQKSRSTDAETLEKIDHPIAQKVLAYRELAKLKNTYVDALPRFVREDGRVHTTFVQTVAATGRLASTEPNLQNIPIRTEEGKRIRECFVAAPGHVLLSCDYSQIELRVLAHYCQEGPLVESFLAGEDIHRRTAGEVFGVAPMLVSAEMRRAAKAINFGIIYGMGAFRLANELGIGRTQAAAYIEGYFARYPQVRAYMEGATARARELGYAETLFGRRRIIAGLDASNQGDRAQAERIAVNTPIQGTAADLIKLAMIEVDRLLAGGPTRMLLQVHDELIFETPADEVERIAPRIVAAMEGVASLVVPLKVEWGAGPSWASAH